MDASYGGEEFNTVGLLLGPQVEARPPPPMEGKENELPTLKAVPRMHLRRNAVWGQVREVSKGG